MKLDWEFILATAGIVGGVGTLLLWDLADSPGERTLLGASGLGIGLVAGFIGDTLRPRGPDVEDDR